VFLLPTGTEEASGRTTPYGAIAACVLIFTTFGLTHNRIERQRQETGEQLQKLVSLWSDHPYVALPSSVLALLPDDLKERHATAQRAVDAFEADPRQAIERLGAWSHGRDDGPLARVAVVSALARDRASRSTWQNTTETAALTWARMHSSSLIQRFGWVPARKSAEGLLGHMVLHGGWLHLILNGLFLWAAAVALEEVWGAFGLLAVLLVGGLSGALGHALAYPESTAPMIGASGAVAGLLGAYLVRLWNTRLRYFYAHPIGGLKWGSFAAPAWLIIPMWFATELTAALILDAPGVAYWAHVAGFLGGLGLALLIRGAQRTGLFGVGSVEGQDYAHRGAGGIGQQVQLFKAAQRDRDLADLDQKPKDGARKPDDQTSGH
jgi:membrane associated rhomboid family serine protease